MMRDSNKNVGLKFELTSSLKNNGALVLFAGKE